MVIDKHPLYVDMLARRYHEVTQMHGTVKALVWAKKYVTNDLWPIVRERILATHPAKNKA